MATPLIRKSLTITVSNGGSIASLNEPLYFYQGDKNIALRFAIADNKFVFKELDNSYVQNAQYAKLKIIKPNYKDEDGNEIQGAKVFTDFFVVEDGIVEFIIDANFSDEIREIGEYQLQIILFDRTKDGRITIPYITFEVLEPIFQDVGYTLSISRPIIEE